MKGETSIQLEKLALVSDVQKLYHILIPKVYTMIWEGFMVNV
jgi:hypothetical protein